MGEKSGWLGRFVSEWEKTVSQLKKNTLSQGALNQHQRRQPYRSRVDCALRAGFDAAAHDYRVKRWLTRIGAAGVLSVNEPDCSLIDGYRDQERKPEENFGAEWQQYGAGDIAHATHQR